METKPPSLHQDQCGSLQESQGETKIWSTNPLERVNKEIKRRTKVVGIFPNETSAIRLVGAILSDLHDEWTVSDRRYLAEHTMTPLTETCDTHPAAPDQLGTG